jgi:hypothetical protein
MNPINKVVLEDPLDQLVENIWSEKAVYVRLRKTIGKWL